MTQARKSILFLCTGNSCRSQMAEGWGRALLGDEFDVYSAGTEPHGINPVAQEVMQEAGVDISAQRSKHVDEYLARTFSLVVTVCDSAAKTCPSFAGAEKSIHRAFDDPPRLAKAAVTAEEGKKQFRRVRDEIKAFVETLRGTINS
jgi:arsenate reductase